MHCDYDAQAVVVEPVTAGTSLLAVLVQTDPEFTSACNYDAQAVVVEPRHRRHYLHVCTTVKALFVRLYHKWYSK